MNAWTYDWVAVRRDGSTLNRWNLDGSENRPDPWYTTQFHLTSCQPGVDPVSIYVPKGAVFRYARRYKLHPDGDRVSGLFYVAGWQMPDDLHGCYLFALPNGRFELHSSFDHNPRWEE